MAVRILRRMKAANDAKEIADYIAKDSKQQSGSLRIAKRRFDSWPNRQALEAHSGLSIPSYQTYGFSK